MPNGLGLSLDGLGQWSMCLALKFKKTRHIKSGEVPSSNLGGDNLLHYNKVLSCKKKSEKPGINFSISKIKNPSHSFLTFFSFCSLLAHFP